MHSKNTINETKNKKTKKIKLRSKMLVILQPIYLQDVLGMSSKSSCATFCHFKKSKFLFRKASLLKFLDVKPARFAVRTESNHDPWKVIVPQQRNLVRGCCTLKTHPPKSVDPLKRKNFFF